jgi:hypothetical protein
MFKLPASESELLLVAWLILLVILGTKIGGIGEAIARLLMRRR